MLEYLELLVIVILLLLLFKPDYIKRMAGSLGQTVAEFKKQQRPVRVTEKELIWIAETLGIDVRGKTDEQLKREIIEKLSST